MQLRSCTLFSVEIPNLFPSANDASHVPAAGALSPGTHEFCCVRDAIRVLGNRHCLCRSGFTQFVFKPRLLVSRVSNARSRGLYARVQIPPEESLMVLERG